MTDQIIGTRLKALRQKRALSQDEMARLFGFKDRQTVSAIETGVRRVTAAELLLAVERLRVPLDYFTDPFRLEGEALFSWRQRGVTRSELGEYERTAGRWIGAYRVLAAQVGRRAPLMRQTLGLTKLSRFEEALDAGERFVAEFKLGVVPAQRLATVMQDNFEILVLMVDAYRGISGAACRLPEFDAVLVARGEVAGRRNFDLAHELFHILTWEAMPPEHTEEASDFGGNRVEQLANNFAAAVLMPKAALDSFGDWGRLEMGDLIARLNATADELGVTSSALRWRLVALRELTKAQARAIPDAALRNNGREDSSEPPPLFSRPFVEVLAKAIDQGHVSVRRAAALVGLAIEDLEKLFAAHGVDQAIGL
ncbi:MAG: XRE family transcriptional regulator [Deltaproteobacteria bacterium]|nr:XRE family transcriptional regulator [Deltaproteobacteria bacterium]